MVKNGNVDEGSEPDFLPIPKGMSARVALDYAEIAKKDFAAAKVLYNKHLYAQAVYSLQQSVEKSAKSFGLMLGILKVNELRAVSHRSVYALLLGMDTFTEHMADRVSWLQTSSKSEVERLRSLGLDSILNKLAFYILESADTLAIKKPMTLSRIGDKGLRRVEINLVDLLESLPWEELCRVHDVHLTFFAENLYKTFLDKGCAPIHGSKDIDLGKFIWSKYRSATAILHHNEKVSVILECTNCPIESSPDNFICMASFLEKCWNGILDKAKGFDPALNVTSPKVEDWLIVQ